MSINKLAFFAPTFRIAIREVEPNQPFAMIVMLKQLQFEKKVLMVVDSGNFGFDVNMEGNEAQLSQIAEEIKEARQLQEKMERVARKRKKGPDTNEDASSSADSISRDKSRILLLLFGLTKSQQSIDFLTTTTVIKLKNASLSNVQVFLGKGEVPEHRSLSKPMPCTPEKTTYDRLTQIQKGHADGKVMAFTLQVVGLGERMERSGTFKGRFYFKVQLNNIPGRPQAVRNIEVTIWDSQEMCMPLSVGNVVKFSTVRCQVRSTQAGATYPVFNVNLMGVNVQPDIMMVKVGGEFESVLKVDEELEDPEGA